MRTSPTSSRIAVSHLWLRRRGSSAGDETETRLGKTALLMNRTYDWQQPYEAAILETDRSRLPKLIAEAQAAIDARMAAMRSLSDGKMNGGADGLFEEKQAIADAQSGIRILIREIS
jgi:hypothetical protein